jgi:hypothetical protein
MDRHHAEREQDARHDAGEEKPRDRDRAARHVGIDDHRVRGGDDRPEIGGRRDDRGREADPVDLRELAHEDRRERARVGDRRARDRRHAGAGEHRDLREPAGDAADEGVGELDQPLSQATADHQLAGKHEERDRHQREGVDRVHHALRQHVEIDAAHGERDERREAEREGERHPEQRDDEEARKDGRAHSAASSCRSGCPERRPLRR